MATCAPRTVPAPRAPRNAPALYLTLCVHLDGVARRLRAIGFRGWLRPSWIAVADGVACHVAIEVDPESDTFLADERRAHREVRDALIAAGFVVGGAPTPAPRPLRVASYHGAAVARAA
jgi:hypothetical protein